MDKYSKRGVSADKTEVHEAIKTLNKGLFPNAFCKILPDYLGNDKKFGNIMHADTAGTKTSLAYMYWRETGDISVWKGIARDAIVMNIDDIACAGVTQDIIISSTIGRNKNLIPGEVIKTIIEENQAFCDSMNELGINMHLAGGETADVGDIVRTIDVGITAVARAKRSRIKQIKIRPGDDIIGLSSTGSTVWDNEYNSSIGSNGLTFARHEVLANSYKQKYPECFDPSLTDDVVFTGNNHLEDPTEVENFNVGQLLLSPTRSYLPILNELYDTFLHEINGIIHCTGGGQTKVLHFADNIHIIKDNLFETPPVFNLIQKQSNADWKEMYKVFNMGHRIEIYCQPGISEDVIYLANKFGIEAKIIGQCEANNNSKLTINSQHGVFNY